MNTIEKQIVRRAVRDLLNAGYLISVNDGETTVLRNNFKLTLIMGAMGSTDEDVLFVRRGAERGWVRFIWGNDCDVISDHTVNLDEVLSGAYALANLLSN